MSKFLTIPIISVYLYGITILTQYGYNSYFNIPSNLIDASITENFVYFFQLFHLTPSVVGAMRWWMWLVLVVGGLIILLFYFSHRFWRFVISVMGIFILAYILYGSYNFGQLIAKSSSEFYVLSDNCSLLNTDTKYVIPNFYHENAILVSIDENNTLTGQVLVKNLSELECSTEKKNVGLIKQ